MNKSLLSFLAYLCIYTAVRLTVKVCGVNDNSLFDTFFWGTIAGIIGSRVMESIQNSES